MTRKIPPGTQCYACEQPASTWEHAPPQGFYPKPKELFRHRVGQKNLRTGLIKVPSCPRHNNSKSANDSYTRTAIATTAAAYSNGIDDHTIAEFPFLRKQIETIQRGKRLRHDFLDTAEQHPTAPLVTVRLDRSAIDQVIEATARALYFHDTGWEKRWPDECKVVSPHFFHDGLREPSYFQAILSAEEKFDLPTTQTQLKVRPRGPHPEVFFYQTLDADELLLTRLVFYGCFRFLVAAKKSDSGLQDLVAAAQRSSYQ